MELSHDDDLSRIWLELGNVDDRLERIERRMLWLKVMICSNLVLTAGLLAVLLMRG